MSCEELPQTVGQLRSKAYEFWKEKESRNTSGIRESPERNFSIKPKPPTSQKPAVNPHVRPPRPTVAPSKSGNTSKVAPVLKHVGGGDGKLATDEEISTQHGGSQAPLPINQRREIKSAATDSSTSSSVGTLANKTRSLEYGSYSDASSYTPKGNKVERASSEKTKEHRKLNKVSSSPVVVPRPEVESKKLSSSWGRTSTTAGGDNNGGIVLRSRKFIPRIETIRASTGDRLSKDDLDLLGAERAGRVQEMAKELNLTLLSPRQSLQEEKEQQKLLSLPSHSQRHASVGESDLSGSSTTSSLRSPSNSPAPNRRFAASVAPGSYRLAVQGEVGKPSNQDVHRNWRSQSASKVRSNSYAIKIKSSGFVSYLDGPIDAPLDQQKPPRPSSPPSILVPPAPQPSPLHAMSNFLKDSDVPEGNHLQVHSSNSLETADFWEMVNRLQAQYCSNGRQHQANLLSSPILSQSLQPSSPAPNRRHESIHLTARRARDVVMVRALAESPANSDVEPVEFTCNVKSLVYTVLSKAVDLLKKERNVGKSAQSCVLKVRGKDEFLEEKCLLCDYEYIHQCRKFSTPVEVVVVEKHRPSPTHLARRDRFPGTNASSTSPIPSATPLSSLTYSSHLSKCLSIKEANYLLDGFHAKEEKFRKFLESKEGPSSPFTVPTMVQSVVSCVKLLCERMSFIEPPEVTDAVFNLRRACKAASQPDIEASSLFTEDAASMPSSSLSDNWVAVPDRGFCMTEDNVEDVRCGLDVLHNAVHRVVSLYCCSFHPGYAPEWAGEHGKGSPSQKTYISTCPDQLLRIKIAAVHRPYLDELQKYDTLQLECCVYHGGKALSKKSYSPHAKLVRSFGHTVVWNKWVNMSLRLKNLTPESRVMFTLHGLEFPGSGIKWSRTPIAWTITRLFDCRGRLERGGRVLGMWLGEDADPLDSPYHNLHNKKTMLLQVEFEDVGKDLYCDAPSSVTESSKSSKTPGPPPNVSKSLINLAKKDRFYNLTTADQKILWDNRLSCVSLLEEFPRGLPVLLLAAKCSDADPGEVQALVQRWKSTAAVNGLELLDPQFSSMVVRGKAVECLSMLSDDDVYDFLPQLVQSIQYDASLLSPMVQFLLHRSTRSQRIAHGLFWNMRLALVINVRFRPRYLPILDALNKLCGEEKQQDFSNQVELVDQLCAVAMAVKNMRDSHRQTTLVEELKGVADKFVGKFRLPLDPSLLVKSIDIESCSFFNSNTVPLKLSFTNADPFGDNVNIIFKVGDDLRQDILILQMVRLMEKIWLRAGLDLKMVTYQCVATGKEEGMLEMVQEASTLRQIQMEHGVTGSFKDKPLSEWLQRHNPSESAYRQAVENFTLSCAGYCVATYVLGICDRHNDNIMVKRSGHMFHIDFGKILGNAQMFGNIRRDRAPFVLTRDMAYVINDGDKPTAKFQQFCDLCCSAYNEIRKHSSLFISVLSLILSSGLPEVTSLEDVRYVRDALLPDKSETEATYAFTKYIEDSLSSMATTLNFFIHNLAQFKFGSGSSTSSLLSFCPQTYSIATSGKIESAIINTYHKWFYPETYYVYQIEVKRAGPEKEKIFRRYREFDELQNKLVQCFPDTHHLPQLPGKILIPGKSHTKQTTERRMVDLNMYLASLLSMPRHVSESDIVYTFLHCLIRDEQDLAKLREDELQDSDYSSGKVKLEMLYNGKQEVLSVMVRHVKGLMPREGFDSADPYVKLYLLPDPNKATKKKTKVTKKTLNPTYNETFVYSLPSATLKKRALQLSIWDASNVLGNHCMCMTTIELARLEEQLTKEDTHLVDWFELFTIPNL